MPQRKAPLTARGGRTRTQTLRASGVQVSMITGDAKETAVAIGTRVGIYNPQRHLCVGQAGGGGGGD